MTEEAIPLSSSSRYRKDLKGDIKYQHYKHRGKGGGIQVKFNDNSCYYSYYMLDTVLGVLQVVHPYTVTIPSFRDETTCSTGTELE